MSDYISPQTSRKRLLVYLSLFVVAVLVLTNFFVYPVADVITSAFGTQVLPIILLPLTVNQTETINFFLHGGEGETGYSDLSVRNLSDDNITNNTLTGYVCDGVNCNFTIVFDSDNVTKTASTAYFDSLTLSNLFYNASDNTWRNVSELSDIGQGNWSYNGTAMNFTLGGADGYDYGVRDALAGGSYWIHANGSVYGRMNISNDFIKVGLTEHNFTIYNASDSTIWNSSFITAVKINNVSITGEYGFGSQNKTVYFFDWSNQSWKVFGKGLGNSTHGMPDWLDPRNKQAFKWRYEFININSTNTTPAVNFTYLMTAHDPFVRIFVDTEPINAVFEDDFDTDDWLDQDSSNAGVDTSDMRFEYTAKRDSSNDASTIDISKTISNDQWVTRFKLRLTDTSCCPAYWIGLYDKDSASGDSTSQDAITFQGDEGTSFDLNYVDDGTLSSSTAGSSKTLVINTNYYVEITRYNATHITLTVYDDSEYTSIFFQDSLNFASSLKDLRYFGFKNRMSSGTDGTQGIVDSLQIYDGITNVTENNIAIPISLGVPKNSTSSHANKTGIYFYNGTTREQVVFATTNIRDKDNSFNITNDTSVYQSLNYTYVFNSTINKNLLLTLGASEPKAPLADLPPLVDCGSDTDNGDGTCTFSSNNPTEDGQVEDVTNDDTCDTVTTRSNTAGTDYLVRVGNSGFAHDCSRGYFEWDISSIPDTATVSNSVFKYEVSSVSTPRNCDITPITSQPSAASDQGLFDDIGDGTEYVDNSDFCTSAGASKEVDLGTTFDSDMNTALSGGQSWIAFGVKTNSETVDATDHHVLFIFEEGSGTPDPTLEITYTPLAGLPTFNPSNITLGYSNESLETIANSTLTYYDFTNGTSEKGSSWNVTDIGGGTAEHNFTHFFNYDGGAAGIWRFDEGSGGNVTDSSGKGRTGVVRGTAWMDNSSCIPGLESCLHFDGSDDHIDLGSEGVSDDLAGASALSISMWAKIDDLDVINPFFGLVQGENDKFSAYHHSAGDPIHFRISTGGAEDCHINNINSIVTEGVWHYYVFRFDGSGSTNDDKCDIIIDGVERDDDSSGTVDSTINSALNDDVFYIGRETNVNSYFTGTIDDVRIYSRALNNTDILEHFRNGVTKYYDEFGTAISYNESYRYFGVENATNATNGTHVMELAAVRTINGRNHSIVNTFGNTTLSFNLTDSDTFDQHDYDQRKILFSGENDADTDKPGITVQEPTNTTNGSTSVWVNVTINETADTVVRSLDGAANVSLTNSSGNWNNQMTSLSEGPHNVIIYANDSAGNDAESVTVFFTVDTTGPTITVDNPTNVTINSTTVWANVTLNEAGDTLFRSLDGGTNTSLTNATGNWYSQMTELIEGPHSVTIYANDSSGNDATAQTVFFTVDIVNITTVNGTSCPSGLICLFSINSTNDTHTGSCGYFNKSVCGEFVSASIQEDSCTGLETGILSFLNVNNTHAGQFGVSNYGNHSCVIPQVNVTVKDSCDIGETCLVSLNATNNSHVGSCDYFGNQVCLSNLPVAISVESPGNITYSNGTSVWINVSLDQAGDVVLRSLDGAANVSLTNSTGNWHNEMTGISQGPHSVTVYANDTDGNNADAKTTFFTIDTVAPTITVGTPTNITFTETSVWVNVTLDDADAGVVVRSLDGGANVSLTNASGNWSNEMTSLSNGPHNVKIYANDSNGNDATAKTVFFTVDFLNITIVNGTSCPSGLVCLFSVNATNNTHAGACGYFNKSVCGNFTSANIRANSCNSGETAIISFLNVNNTHAGQFDVSNYANHTCVSPGVNVTLRNSCNANEVCLVSLNATNNSHVASCNYFGNQLCLLDGVGPNMTVLGPTNDTYDITDVWANVTLDEPAGAVVRSVDGGANVTLANVSGNWSNEMTSLSEGPHSVVIYSNDTKSNDAAPQTIFFTVLTDASPPDITIDNPTNTTFTNSTVEINVTLNETGDTVLRSLDGGANVSLVNSTGDWNNEMTGVVEGPHQLIIYANDSKGNEEAENVNFTVDLPPTHSNVGSASGEVDPDVSVRLYAQWADGIGLGTAILETNETGDFVNYTSTYNSTTSLSGTSDWSNFTWQNTSISNGTTVAWKIYANDSHGNQNVTGTNTFIIKKSIGITVSSPTNTTYFSTTVSGEVTTSKAVSSCSRSLNGGGNVSLTNSSGTWNGGIIGGVAGPNNVVFYCEDSSGFSNSSETIFFTLQGEILQITAESLYSQTGVPVTSGEVTATILETGESNSTTITSSEWVLSLTSLQDLNETKVTIGIFIKDDQGKSGYYTMLVGTGTVLDESTTCKTNTVTFTGTAIDPNIGSLTSSGTVRVEVPEVGFINSTSYSNSVWDISVGACLIPGKIYDFNILLTDDAGGSGLITLRQVAK